MPRRVGAGRSVGHLLASGLLALGSSGGCADPGPIRPNLLLVTVDSLRADALHCYGGDASVGLQMCAIGDRGARYIWAFSASSDSASAIASLLSSTYPSHHEVDSSAASFLPEAVDTLPEQLRRAGYATAAFIGSPELNRSRNLQQGFDRYEDRLAERNASGLSERRAGDLTEAAIRWIQDGPTPWFVWIHYRDPHGPYDAPAAGRIAGPSAGERRSESGLRSRRAERLRVLSTPTGRGGIPGYQAIPGLFTREAYELRYRAEIRYVDGQLARLLAVVDASETPTGVLVTADHGEAFGEDAYFFMHGQSVGLEQIRIPLLWYPPDGTQSPASSAPVSSLDVAPSLLRAAGLPAPESFDGRPLPTADDPSQARGMPRAIFAEGPRQLAVVSGGVYYARDRNHDRPLAAGSLGAEALARVSARVARFDEPTAASGRERLPRYEAAEPSGVSSVMEPLLAEFLSGTAPR